MDNCHAILMAVAPWNVARSLLVYRSQKTSFHLLVLVFMYVHDKGVTVIQEMVRVRTNSLEDSVYRSGLMSANMQRIGQGVLKPLSGLSENSHGDKLSLHCSPLCKFNERQNLFQKCSMQSNYFFLKKFSAHLKISVRITNEIKF